MSPPAPRPALRLIKGTLDEAPGWSWFCGHCAAAPSRQLVSPLTRVCGSCGMGLLLETRSDAAPGSDDAFLVIDSRLTVQAVSRDAERLLGINEDEMVDGPVTQFLGAADAEAREPEEFLYLLHRASTGADELHSVFVRPRNAFGVRIVARIAPCGPPRAALVVLGRQAPRSGLRVVSDD